MLGHKKTRRGGRVGERVPKAVEAGRSRFSLLPSALLMAIRLQALTTLVFVHLETALRLEVAHGVKTEVETI